MVNFVFAVAHFCEIHGPATVLCTQKQEFGASVSKSSMALCESCSFVLPPGITSLTTNYERGNCSHRSDGRKSNGNSNESAADGSENPVERKGSLRALLRLDAKNANKNTETVAYISTLYPQSERIFTCLTKLVMKCLSVEAVAEPLKPVFFGDTGTGYCLSKIFSIPDLHARGAERKYALMIVSDSERALLVNWDIALAYIAQIISLLQQTVENHNMERGKLDTADNGRYLRRAKTIPRSLVQLTGDIEVFMKLHLCGTEILTNMQLP